MISEQTVAQLDRLKIDPHKPLLISDVDDVIVDFISCFNGFLKTEGHELRPSPRHYHGEVFKIGGDEPIDLKLTSNFIDDFFAAETQNMTPIEGSVEAIKRLGETYSVVMLTNLPHSAGDQRRLNMDKLGVPYTVITNSGPKGPALKRIAQMTTGKVAFIDDSHFFLGSAFETAPHVGLVHFLHNMNFGINAPQLEYAPRAHNWIDAEAALNKLLSN